VPTRIDIQRYKKTYPFLRREPRLFYLSTTDPESGMAANIKTAQVSFGGLDEITLVFSTLGGSSFTSAPKVTVSPLGAEANFNVFVSSVSTTQVVIRASTPNSQSVHVHAIEVL